MLILDTLPNGEWFVCNQRNNTLTRLSVDEAELLKQMLADTDFDDADAFDFDTDIEED